MFTLSITRVRTGLASLAIVFAASNFAVAGGIGGKLFSGSSANSNRGNNTISQNTQNNNFFSQNNTSNRVLANQKPIVLNNVGNNTGNNKSDKNILNINKVDNKLALNNSLGNKKISDNFAGKKILLSDNQDKKLDKKCDPCHDKCCFHSCPWWYCWNYPCWTPLYGCGCGYWYDVPVVEVQGLDLQLLAVRMVDSGDPENNLGPAFRVWFRNNSNVTIDHGFNVLVLAAHDATPTADLPQAGVRIPSIEAGQTLAADIRLPVAANQPGLPMLHVLVDSHREIPEVNEANNGMVLARGDILPVEMPAKTTAGGEGGTASTAPAADAN